MRRGTALATKYSVRELRVRNGFDLIDLNAVLAVSVIISDRDEDSLPELAMKREQSFGLFHGIRKREVYLQMTVVEVVKC